MNEDLFGQKTEEIIEVDVDTNFGLQCKITYAEFCEMKRTNPNWKGPRETKDI